MKKLLLLLSLLLTALSACSGTASKQTNQVKPQVTIVVAQETPPPSCQLSPREAISISLKGVLPDNAKVIWRVRGGGEFAEPDQVTTVYTAPEQPSSNTVEITAAIITGEAGLVEVQQNCVVVTQGMAQDTPTSVAEVLISPSPMPTANVAPSIPPPAPDAVPAAPGLVAITEIMGNPCGKQNEERANEYIELYNYSDDPVDLAGVYLIASSQEETDHPDQLVAWKTRNSVPEAFANLVTDSTVIKPKAYALILEPEYHLIESASKMPYDIPSGTLILTLSRKNRLGNATGGLITSGSGKRDSVYLYTGSEVRVEKIISTYAILNAGPYPYSISIPDKLPLEAGDCQSVQRRTIPGQDKSANWITGEGTPGKELK